MNKRVAVFDKEKKGVVLGRMRGRRGREAHTTVCLHKGGQIENFLLGFRLGRKKRASMSNV
jgi:hypothetical protein